SNDWAQICAVVSREAPHLFLLNEMPFGAWISSGDAFDERVWNESCFAHEAGVARAGELSASFVAGSRPMRSDTLRTNEAFLWSGDRVMQGLHTKQYFP